MIRRVVKVGGSCLSNPSFPRDLRDWLESQPEAENWLVIGGGEVIDAMRHLDARFKLDQRAMHWRCVQLLRTTFEVVHELFPNIPTIQDAVTLAERIDASRSLTNWLVDINCFYQNRASVDAKLPENWDTTTDSIAALLARICNAESLVLLKSCKATVSDPASLANLGIVDRAFAQSLPPSCHLQVTQLQSHSRST